ncbi:cupin domain-containing protein [Catellatospora sp. KI3]|uniref:cupin domain-containing protein n=1 Tax=Catellatospora sp. KI3 TaxID=3041620 RepID=UPI0024830E15|nr:cupin domain-containing protein [Catellatospora sp. KI3]MDI1463031.1 cupin domain-containing protein [Catellatospora sp. KI3]
MRGGVLVRAGEAERLTRDPGSVITLLADAPHTGNVLTSNRSLLKAGSPGAPPHFHERSDEILFMLGGELEVLLGEEIVTLNQGDLLIVPPYMPHAFAPAPGTDADVLFLFTPGPARFEYYRLLDRFHAGQATAEDIKAAQEQYDNHHLLSAPQWTDRHRQTV